MLHYGGTIWGASEMFKNMISAFKILTSEWKLVITADKNPVGFEIWEVSELPKKRIHLCGQGQNHPRESLSPPLHHLWPLPHSLPGKAIPGKSEQG